MPGRPAEQPEGGSVGLGRGAFLGEVEGDLWPFSRERRCTGGLQLQVFPGETDDPDHMVPLSSRSDEI